MATATVPTVNLHRVQYLLTGEQTTLSPTAVMMEDAFRTFAARVFIPCWVQGGGALRNVYGICKQTHYELRCMLIVPEALFPVNRDTLLSCFAHMSGLTFCCLHSIKRRQKASKQIAPLLPSSWTTAHYHNGSRQDCIMKMIEILELACWSRSFHTEVGGVSYIGTHSHAEPGEHYPGACHLLVQRGRGRGAPRWP